MTKIDQLRANAEYAIAELRKAIVEPVSLRYSKSVDVEIRPLTDDDRILVGKFGMGCTVINYSDEGVSVATFAENDMDPMCDYWLDRSDLGEQE